jgi:hypothetical protein
MKTFSNRMNFTASENPSYNSNQPWNFSFHTHNSMKNIVIFTELRVCLVSNKKLSVLLRAGSQGRSSQDDDASSITYTMGGNSTKQLKLS